MAAFEKCITLQRIFFTFACSAVTLEKVHKLLHGGVILLDKLSYQGLKIVTVLLIKS